MSQEQSLAGHLVHEAVFQSVPGFTPTPPPLPHVLHICDMLVDVNPTVIVESRLVAGGETTIDVYRDPSRQRLIALLVIPLDDKPPGHRVARVSVYDRLLSGGEVAFLSNRHNKDRTGPAINERQKVLDEIVTIAEGRLDSCRMGAIDGMAHRYCQLLNDLGATKEREHVYAYYQSLV